jgi:hypothetical protein
MLTAWTDARSQSGDAFRYSFSGGGELSRETDAVRA